MGQQTQDAKLTYVDGHLYSDIATVSTNDIAQLAGARKAPEKEQTVPMTVWISDSEPHYLVRAEIEPAPDAKLVLTLSDFGKEVNVTKPEMTTP